MISNFLNRCLSELIPSKMSKGKRHLPWITPAIKRQMRKRDRLFKKARRQPNTAAGSRLGSLETKSLKLFIRLIATTSTTSLGLVLQTIQKPSGRISNAAVRNTLEYHLYAPPPSCVLQVEIKLRLLTTTSNRCLRKKILHRNHQMTAPHMH